MFGSETVGGLEARRSLLSGRRQVLEHRAYAWGQCSNGRGTRTNSRVFPSLNHKEEVIAREGESGGECLY